MVSGGSDNHLILLDLRKYGISGQQLEDALSEVGIIVNKNAVKDDPLPKSQTSGIRLGTAAITTRGFKEDEMKLIAGFINEALRNKDNQEILNKIKYEVCELMKKHPYLED